MRTYKANSAYPFHNYGNYTPIPPKSRSLAVTMLAEGLPIHITQQRLIVHYLKRCPHLQHWHELAGWHYSDFRQRSSRSLRLHLHQRFSTSIPALMFQQHSEA